MTGGIDDVFPANEDMAWTSIIQCVGCGDGGRMHSTGEPRDQTVWECDTCDEETIHEVVMKSPDGVVPDE